VLEEAGAPPSLYEHTCRVFEEMRKRSVVQRGDGGIDMIVYEGFMTGLFSELGMSIPYYTKIMRRLKAMGCVRQLKRGGGAAPSRWEILEEPSEEDFMAADREVDDKVPAVSRASVQEQQISDLATRLDELETWREKFMQALARGEGLGNTG
jgi:hypothetical protein